MGDVAQLAAINDGLAALVTMHADLCSASTKRDLMADGVQARFNELLGD